VRPVKKLRTGGGSGLSAMLPAPKRSSAAKAAAAVQPVVNNETEAIGPREPDANTVERNKEEKSAETKETMNARSSTIFVPQSVAKKPIQPTSAFKKQTESTKIISKASLPKPKTSLFGSGERSEIEAIRIAG